MMKVAAASHALEALLDERAAPHDEDDDALDLDADDLQKLSSAIAESEAQFARGEGIPAEVVLAKMRRRLYSA